MANKLDQLFRETLDQYEMNPSSQSWDKVQDRLAGSQKNTWLTPWRIAAAIALLVTAAVLTLTYEPDRPMEFVAGADHPIESETFAWNVQVPDKPTPKKPSEPSLAGAPAPAAPAESLVPEEQPVAYSTLQVARISDFKIDQELPVKTSFPLKTDPDTEPYAIRITYITASTSESPEDSENKLEKVFSIARELSATELLADLRDAKDNIFRRN